MRAYDSSRRYRAAIPTSGDALPPGTWVQYKGVRRFVPADPSWKPSDVDSVLRGLRAETPALDVPEPRPYRHVCDCGCLLFGVENCPNCEWNALQNRHEEAA